MVRINPGKKTVDNDTKTATPGGMEAINIPEPKMLDKGKLECPVCSRMFNSRQDYDSHALAQHQATEESLASGSMGSMRTETTQQPSA